MAVDNENIDIIKLLLSKNVDIDEYSKKDGEKMTPLHYSIKKKNFEIFKLLLDNNADVNKPTFDDIEDIKDIKNNASVIHFAVSYGNRQIVEYLLNLNKDWINSVKQWGNGKTAHLLYSSIICSNLDTFKYLLEIGVDPNDPVNTQDCLITAAAPVSCPEILGILLDKGCQDPSLNKPLLDIAIISFNYKLVPFLLKRNETVTATNLYDACHSKFKPSIIKLLLDHISDHEFNSPSNGFYACHWMIMGSNPKVVKMFLEKGVDVNMLSQDGCTCVSLLKNSGENETKKILNLFEGYGFDVNLNCVSANGTPTNSTLANALTSMKLNLVLIEWLLNHGARTDFIMPGRKITILEYVQKSGNTKLINLVSKYS